MIDMRDTSRWMHYSQCEFDSLKDFLSANLSRPSLAGVKHEGGQFDFLCDLQPQSDALVVFFQGAVDRLKAPLLPNFTGVSFLRDYKVSKLFISDPALYLDPELRLGWYAGFAGCDVRSAVNTVVAAFVDRLKPKKLILVGGSGGGLATLWAASFFPKSLAIVWNPQTNILNYARGHVDDFARICYRTTPEALPSTLETRVSRRYVDGQRNYILYLQNSNDWHVDAHMKPFLADMGLKIPSANCSMNLSERFFLYKASDWGEGHTAPPLALLQRIMGVALGPHAIENLFWRSRFAV